MLDEVIDVPVICAPMAGGPSTPELAVAVSNAGGLGFLAAGYKTAGQVNDEIYAVRGATSRPFGVNLFVPRRDVADVSAINSYLRELAPEAEALGAVLAAPTWDDDHWQDKVALLVSNPVAVVSFTFGCPSNEEMGALHDVGSRVVVTVTSTDEATIALERGADALALQGVEAGGHRSRFSDQSDDPELGVRQLLQEIRPLTTIDLIAAGGIMTGRVAADLLEVGASAVQCGTAFLLCPESGVNATHRAALTDRTFAETSFTKAFSGRTARGLVNQMMKDHSAAPSGYPEINNATKPLKQAAVKVGDAHHTNLWAGVGFAQATKEPAAHVIARLSDPQS
jgi:nitronate monooxygenase